MVSCRAFDIGLGNNPMEGFLLAAICLDGRADPVSNPLLQPATALAAPPIYCEE